MADAGFMNNETEIWAYGPDSGTAALRAEEFAHQNSRVLGRGNPREQTMGIEPSGRSAGRYKVFVFTVGEE